jgi:arylformamidase
MIVDVSVSLRPGMPHWPSQPGFERDVLKSIEQGAHDTVSALRFGAHTGTHIDAPLHFIAGGGGIESIDLEACVGPGWVAELAAVTGAISADDLERAGIPASTTRLLAKTRNSGWSRETAFREDFCAFDASGAQWCVERGMCLVGIDYLSIEPYGSGNIGNPTHRTLLGAGVVVVEGVELADVEPGAWDILALPVKIDGGDGAPARVLLRR